MGLTKPIEQNLFSYQGTFMYLKDIIRVGDIKKKSGRPISPKPEEIERNPRARSAKLRVAEKI